MYKDIINKIKNCLPKNQSDFVIHKPTFDIKSINDSRKCLLSSFVSTNGEYLDKFELKLKKLTNSKYVLLTSSGTSALFLSLKIHKVDMTEILVPSMTFAATINSILYNNAIPHFIDCEIDSPNIDINKLNSYLSNNFIVENKICINKTTKNVLAALWLCTHMGFQ